MSKGPLGAPPQVPAAHARFPIVHECPEMNRVGLEPAPVAPAPVGPAGERDITELAALCEGVDAKGGTTTEAVAAPQGLGADDVLYLKNACGFSRRVKVAVDNLHANGLKIRNASEDSDALGALRELSGAETAPCLSVAGKPIGEADVIVRTLADRLAPIS